MKHHIIAALIALSLPALADQTVNYQFINQGKIEGAQTVLYRDDGRVEIDYHFNDRGRGPKIREELTLNAQGILTRSKISGKSYMGAAVNESFYVDDKGAHWQNGVDDGSVLAQNSKPVQNSAYYVSMNGTPEGYVNMVRAALKQPNQKLKLLPSGELSVSLVKTINVPVGESTQHANLYAVSGLGFTPDHVWLTDDLRYIGFASEWSSLILDGWQSALEPLKTEAEAVNKSFYANLSKQATRAAPKQLRISNVRVLDVVAGSLGNTQDVWIKDGKFIAAPSKKAAKQFEVIDGKGAVMMPGLWDMHSHIFDDSAILNIAGGVTSVRDLGNAKKELNDLIARIKSGEIAGPHVYRAALIDGESQFRAPTGDIAKTEEEALKLIDAIASDGFMQIKLYSSIPPAWVPALAKRAHEKGLRVSGHIPAFMSAEEAVKSGFDEIQHINMVFLNFLASKTDDTRTPLRFTLVGDKAGELDLNSQAVKDFVQLLKQKQTVVDPTLGIFVAMFAHEKGKTNPSYASISQHFPLSVQRGLLQPEMDINDQNRSAYKKTSAALLQMTKLLYDNGVPLVAGTDDMAGFALHRELELYVEAGIPIADVLRIATVNAATLVGAGNSKGQIKEGFDADLILLEGNPLESIQAQRKVKLVMKGDALYDPTKIYEGMSIRGFVGVGSSED